MPGGPTRCWSSKWSSKLLKRIENLSATKRALLHRRLFERSKPIKQGVAINDKRLVAYLVCESEDPDTVDLVRAALDAQLPEHMVTDATDATDATNALHATDTAQPQHSETALHASQVIPEKVQVP